MIEGTWLAYFAGFCLGWLLGDAIRGLVRRITRRVDESHIVITVDGRQAIEELDRLEAKVKQVEKAMLNLPTGDAP